MPESQDFLEHHGVLGMKWGKHKKSTPSSSSPKKAGPAPKSRAELRALNKVARAENKAAAAAQRQKAANDQAKAQAAQDKKILTARDNLGKHYNEYAAAKKQYKVDKKVVGKVAAKRVVKEAEAKLTKTFETSQLLTGKEQHQKLMMDFADVAVNAMFDAAANRRALR